MRLPADNRREPSPKLKHATACFKLRKIPGGADKILGICRGGTCWSIIKTYETLELAFIHNK